MELSAAAADYGAAITLMSTDIEGIADGIKEMHEIWANVFELGVAVYLLQLYIGSACFVAVIPAVGKEDLLILLQWCNGVRLTTISLQHCYIILHRRYWSRSR